MGDVHVGIIRVYVVAAILGQHSRGWIENQEQTLPHPPVTSSPGLSDLGPNDGNTSRL